MKTENNSTDIHFRNRVAVSVLSSLILLPPDNIFLVASEDELQILAHRYADKALDLANGFMDLVPEEDYSDEEEDEFKTLDSRLWKLRVDSNLTEAELAEQLGVTEEQIEFMEKISVSNLHFPKCRPSYCLNQPYFELVELIYDFYGVSLFFERSRAGQLIETDTSEIFPIMIWQAQQEMKLNGIKPVYWKQLFLKVTEESSLQNMSLDELTKLIRFLINCRLGTERLNDFLPTSANQPETEETAITGED